MWEIVAVFYRLGFSKMSKFFVILTLIVCAHTRLVPESAVAQKVWVNTQGMEFVYIEPGTFTMGSDEEKNTIRGTFVLSRQRPAHRVHISRAFYLGMYEVTQQHWETVMGSNPSFFKGRDHPVENISWNEVNAFIRELNKLEGETVYRLPTEAEWEYAAKASTDLRYAGTNNVIDLCLYANVADVSERRKHPEWDGWRERSVSCDDGFDGTSPVGSLLPNAWGLYDMTGNVWEWVNDWYDAGYYSVSPVIDPQGPARGTHHVKRGGSWTDSERFLPVWFRIGDAPGIRRGNMLGFRIVRNVVP